MKSMHLKYINDSIRVFDIASEYGVNTTQQLSVFLECAKYEGHALYQIFGEDSTDPSFLKKYAAVRKLMLGSPKRSNDGLGLLTWGEPIYRRERAVLLTVKGKKLLKAIFQAIEAP